MLLPVLPSPSLAQDYPMYLSSFVSYSRNSVNVSLINPYGSCDLYKCVYGHI